MYLEALRTRVNEFLTDLEQEEDQNNDLTDYVKNLENVVASIKEENELLIGENSDLANEIAELKEEINEFTIRYDR